jgi:hypothetical protein
LRPLSPTVFCGGASASERAEPGTSKSTQCVKVPTGASGSSTMSAKERVPAGGSSHSSGGERFSPSQV